MKKLLLTVGIVLIFLSEILRTVFLLPFAASQHLHAIGWAYFFYEHIAWLRLLAFLLMVYPAIYILRNSRTWKKIALGTGIMLYGLLFFYLNFYIVSADMYQQPGIKKFAVKESNKVSTDKLVIGISLNDEAKAYPVQQIGYHHFISDTVGKVPLIVTYCSICRSGRIYSSLIDGQTHTFGLVGVNRFNAVLRDPGTKSWWQQATGMAIAGPMKGKSLEELPSRQVTLSSWLKTYPKSTIMQPDPGYINQYKLFADLEGGAFKGAVMQTDSASYKAKSLVVGIMNEGKAKAYDWNKLRHKRVVEDSLKGLHVLLTVEKDNVSFHAWNRQLEGHTLQFVKLNDDTQVKDMNTGSTWNLSGTCIEGALEGKQLEEIQSYQETRQSWNEFHPDTEEHDMSVF